MFAGVEILHNQMQDKIQMGLCSLASEDGALPFIRRRVYVSA
jgi:hypothetical protein